MSERFEPMRRAEFTPTNGTKCSVVGWGYTTDPYDVYANYARKMFNFPKMIAQYFIPYARRMQPMHTDYHIIY